MDLELPSSELPGCFRNVEPFSGPIQWEIWWRGSEVIFLISSRLFWGVPLFENPACSLFIMMLFPFRQWCQCMKWVPMKWKLKVMFILSCQQADLISLGKVVLALACNSLAGIQRENLQKAMELVTINYSSDLKNLIL